MFVLLFSEFFPVIYWIFPVMVFVRQTIKKFTYLLINSKRQKLYVARSQDKEFQLPRNRSKYCLREVLFVFIEKQ